MSKASRTCKAKVTKGRATTSCDAPVSYGQADAWYCKNHGPLYLDGEEFFAKEAFRILTDILEEDRIGRFLPNSIRAECKSLLAKSQNRKAEKDEHAIRF